MIGTWILPGGYVINPAGVCDYRAKTHKSRALSHNSKWRKTQTRTVLLLTIAGAVNSTNEAAHAQY